MSAYPRACREMYLNSHVHVHVLILPCLSHFLHELALNHFESEWRVIWREMHWCAAVGAKYVRACVKIYT